MGSLADPVAMIAESVLASDVSSAKSQAGREEGSPPAIRLRRVSRNFSGIQAVDGVDLEVQQGEFFYVVGAVGFGQNHLFAEERGL